MQIKQNIESNRQKEYQKSDTYTTPGPGEIQTCLKSKSTKQKRKKKTKAP